MGALKTFKLDDNRELRIYQDEDPLNPLVDFDHVGEFFHWHRRYDIAGMIKISGPDDMPEMGADEKRLPLYMYDHSGVRISTGPFPCAWDSGQAGFVRAVPSAEDAGTPELEEVLKAEVRTLDYYISGNVYRYEVVKKVPCGSCGHVAEEDESGVGSYFGELFDITKQIWDEVCPGKEFPDG